jgi:hypothetical protein
MFRGLMRNIKIMLEKFLIKLIVEITIETPIISHKGKDGLLPPPDEI